MFLNNGFNRSAGKLSKQKTRRQVRYGLSEKTYLDMLDKQDDRCAICAKRFGEEKHNKPHVDHDHVSGEVRGLLCFVCNAALGAFKDNEDMLRKAAEYVKRGNGYDGT